MNHCRQTIAIIFTLSASMLQAMQQSTEAPFEWLNKDPKCPVQFLRYDSKLHQTDLQQILESKTTKRRENWTQDVPIWQILFPDSVFWIRENVSGIINLFNYQDLNFSRHYRHYIIQNKKNQQETIGFIRWQTSRGGDSAYLSGLALHNHYRRKGIGKLAVYGVLKYEHEYGAKDVQTEMYMHDQNAIDFLERIGFVKNYQCTDRISDQFGKYKSYGLSMQLDTQVLDSIKLRITSNVVEALSKQLTPLSTGSTALPIMNTPPIKSTNSSKNISLPKPRLTHVSATSSNSCAQIARVLDVTGKVFFAGGLLLKLTSATRYAPTWLQQRSRHACGIAALGVLCYGASRWMHKKGPS